MENIMDTLITDRTQADVDRAKYLNGLWDPRALQWKGTPQERAEWEAGPRGAYSFSDMNRVTQAAAYLIGKLEELGYSVDVEDVTPAYNIQVNVDPAGGGVVSGGGAYYEGDTATVTAQPGEKYDFSGWKGNGQIVSESASYSFVVTGPKNLTAAFALKKFQVIASVDPPGSGEVAGAGTYDIDTEVTVAATAGESYVFARWAEDGVTVSEGPEYTFTLDRDRTLSAVMAKTYAITVMQNDPDGGTTTGSGTYLDGQIVTVAAVAGDGYEFTGWTENGQTVSTDAVYSFQAADDRNLIAQFVKIHVITLLVDPAGWGTATGGGAALEGAQVTITAVPDSGYRFVAWKSDGEQVSTSNPYTFVVTGDQTLTALFEEIPVYTVTATIDPPEAGTVTGTGQYQEGEICTLKATASGTNQFVGWKDGDTVVSTTDTYSFAVTGSVSLTAAFKTLSIFWNVVSLPVGAGYGLTFGNNLFVTVSGSNGGSNRSSDGVNWISSTIPNVSYCSNLVFGNGAFVADGMYNNSTQSTYRSTNGTTWTRKLGPAGSSASLKGLSFANGIFFALYSATTYYRSTDGTTWTTKTTLPSGPSAWYSVAYGNGLYIATANSTTAAYSTDGNTWTKSTMPSGGAWRVAFGNGVFVAVNQTNTSSYAKAAISKDNGKTWEKLTLPLNVSCGHIIFANGMFFVSSYTSANVFYSSDGENWKTSTIPGNVTSGWRYMAYGNGKLVITSSNQAAYAEI